LLVPPGVVTFTVLAESPALVVMVNVVVIVVELATVMAPMLTPDPDTATVVPVAAMLLPVSVTGTGVPRRPVAGATEVSVGTGGPTTVKVTVLLVPPGVVVTLTFRALIVAVAEIASVAVTVASLTTIRLLYVTPVLDTVIAVAPVRPLPLRVTGTLVPRVPELGVIVVSTGPNTVNVCVLLVPPGTLTLTFLAPSAAVPEIVNVAVIVAEFTIVTALTVTPVPLTTTVVPVAAKLLPDKVTGTLMPRSPLLRVTEVSVGVAGLTTLSVKL